MDDEAKKIKQFEAKIEGHIDGSLFEEYLKKMNDTSQHYIEEMAAAFAKHTNLSPDQIVMYIETGFEQPGFKFVQRVWFEEKVKVVGLLGDESHE